MEESKRIRAYLGPLGVLFALFVAMWLLHRELSQFHLRDIFHAMSEIRPWVLILAGVLTVLNYTVLIGYDALGLNYVGHRLDWRRVVLASFLGCSIGNSFGLLLGSSTVRLRLYSLWGLSSVDIVRLLLMMSATFWIGALSVSSIVFLFDPIPIPDKLYLPIKNTFPLALIFLTIVGAYFVLCFRNAKPFAFKEWEFQFPNWRFALMQLGVSAVDLTLVAGVLYALLPASVQVSYAHFLGIYLLALIVAVVSHVPGGVGVLELVVVVLLNPPEPQAVMASLLVFRAIYYLTPLAIGLSVLALNELLPHKPKIESALSGAGRWTKVLVPRFFAVTVFVAGVTLLLSGAIPTDEIRMRWLRTLLPLPVIEASHLLGSVAGLLLLMVARGLQRRVETAYFAVVLLLFFGVLFSLLKGADFEEAAILGLMLMAFVPCRSHFYRKGAFLTERMSLQWFLAIALVLTTAIWLMLFAYKHVEYKHELWWRFAIDGDAPRSIRAMACAVLVTLVIAFARLLRARPVLPSSPTESDLAIAKKIVHSSPHTSANLALLGDKYFLFNEEQTGFVMYGIEGRSWISMGDPVGAADTRRELAWLFREQCDEGGRWPVFYQIDSENIPTYIEMGLTLVKLGEEARVPLTHFNLEGSERKSLRKTVKQMKEADCRFEIIEPPLNEAIMHELKAVSDAWVGEKATAEKGFSLGFFQPDYIRQGAVAVLRQENRIIAFANLWNSDEKEELSVDLMRGVPDAPHGCMEYLFVELMLWGHDQGYKWFNLGMAPLSGLERHALGPMWNRMASLLYRHGEHFYNFQGLRQYKDKFRPVWTPKYLASPGGLALPVILANLAALISGGLTKIWKK